MENILRCFQCHASLRFGRLKNHVHAWRVKSPTLEFLTNFENSETGLNPWSRPTLRSSMGRSRKRNVWMELKLKRCKFRVWWWYCHSIFIRTRHRSCLPCPSGSLRRLRVLREETTGNRIQCTELLWIILEFWSNDECRWIANVFIPNIKGD